jgi:hypothetical protein
MWPSAQDRYKADIASLIGTDVASIQDLQALVSDDSGVGNDYTPTEGGSADVTVVIVAKTGVMDVAVGAVVNSATFAGDLESAIANDALLDVTIDATTMAVNRIPGASAQRYSNDDDTVVALPADEVVSSLGSDGGPQLLQGSTGVPLCGKDGVTPPCPIIDVRYSPEGAEDGLQVAVGLRMQASVEEGTSYVAFQLHWSAGAIAVAAGAAVVLLVFAVQLARRKHARNIDILARTPAAECAGGLL